MNIHLKSLVYIASIITNFYFVMSIIVASQKDWYFVGYFNRFGEGLLELILFVPVSIFAIIYMVYYSWKDDASEILAKQQDELESLLLAEE